MNFGGPTSGNHRFTVLEFKIQRCTALSLAYRMDRRQTSLFVFSVLISVYVVLHLFRIALDFLLPKSSGRATEQGLGIPWSHGENGKARNSKNRNMR